jgi:hypothetical protein
MSALAAQASGRPERPGAPSWAEATSGLRVQEEWVRAIFGSSIGGVGLNIADLDGSGELKIVASAFAGPFGSTSYYWYVLSYSSGGYRQEWVSSPYAAGISAVRTKNLDGVPGAEIVVAAGDEIFIYDGATRELLRNIQTAARSIGDLKIADADGNGELELVFCDVDYSGGVALGLAIYDLATGEQEFYAEEYACWQVDVGNVDGDRSPELVLGSSEHPGRVLDGTTHVLEWTYPPGFGDLVRLGDVDRDGLEEIVAGPFWSSPITIYDADLRSSAWEIPTDFGLDELQVLDVEGDGQLDIVYSDSVGNALYAWDPWAREQKWTIANPATGVAELAAGDTDGDGRRELLWGAGDGSTGPDYLYVAEAGAGAPVLEWQSQDLRGPFRALDFGDVDDDGRPELLYGTSSSESGYGDGLFFIHDARTKELEYESGPTTGDNWLGVQSIRHADVDTDPQAELFVTTSHAYTGVLICYDGISFTEQWRWEASPHEGIYSLEPADIDGDGEVEVVVGGEGNVYVLDGATGVEEWRSTGLGGRLWNLRLADIDADRNMEILVAHDRGRLFALDGVTRVQEWATDELFVSALETVDQDGDGIPEILIGTSPLFGTTSGEVARVDAASGLVAETLARYDEPINALAVVDVTEDLVPDLVVALPEEVAIYDGRFPSEKLWGSGLIGHGVGERNSLRVGDIDEDGRLEILVNVGEMGFRVYQIQGPGSELPPGPFLVSPELPGFRFKVQINAGGEEIAGRQEADCIVGTLCVSGALPGRSELFLRLIGPRPNGLLWMNLVRFTPSRIEVWAEQISSGWINYYELPALPRGDTELAGLVDKEAFPPEEAAAPAVASVRARGFGAPGVALSPPSDSLRWVPPLAAKEPTFVSDTFPGYRFRIRIESGGKEQAVRFESDCIPETLCVSGALPGRSELFLRIIGPRPNGFLWTNLVRFTTSRVEVEIEQVATGETRIYVLDEVPRQGDQLPGRVDREAFPP